MSYGVSITQDGTVLQTAGKYVDQDIVVGISDSIKKAAATYTPTTTDQTIAAGQYLSGAQTIEGDANLVAGNIKHGVSIFGVSGNLAQKENVTWHQCPEAVRDFLDEISYPSEQEIIWTPNFQTAGGDIVWSTADSSIATVTANDSASGLIKAITRTAETSNLRTTITAAKGTETLTLTVRIDNDGYTGMKTVLSCIRPNYSPSTIDVNNSKPVGITVDGVTYRNEVPDIETPFASANAAGTLKPLDKLRWLNTVIASGTHYTLGRNTRDLGGWTCDGGTVKYGLLVRGGEINPADKALMVGDVGIRTEVSLLQTSKQQYSSSPWGIDYIVNPTDTEFAYQISGSNIVPLWRLFLDEIFKSVSHSKPVYFHCGYGADKTGTVAVILLALLGVSISDITKDFELTSFAVTDQARYKYLPNLFERINAIPLYGGLEDTFRNRVVSYVLSLSDAAHEFTIDRINEFRGLCIDGSPMPISVDAIISNNLTHCSNSNTASSASIGASYSATISPDSGYTMQSIAVTMGGIDITSTVVSGNTLSITSVTGNIVITAVAIPAVIPIVNLIEVYGAAENQRISLSSGGKNTAQSGYCSIGSSNADGHVIPAQTGDVFRFKGFSIPMVQDTKCLIAFYDDTSGTYTTQTGNYIYQGGVKDYITTSAMDADGVVSITVTNMPTGKHGIRFAVPMPDLTQSIITKNQEIV